jgi:hypothetical protein
MKNVILTLFIALTAVIHSHAQTTTMELEDFKNINVDVDAEISVVPSYEDKILINQDAEALNNYNIEVRNNVLHIRYVGSQEPANVRMRIYTNSISSIHADGGAQVNVSNQFKYFENLQLRAANQSSIEMNDNRVAMLFAQTSEESIVNCKGAKDSQYIVDGQIQ